MVASDFYCWSLACLRDRNNNDNYYNHSSSSSGSSSRIKDNDNKNIKSSNNNNNINNINKNYLSTILVLEQAQMHGIDLLNVPKWVLSRIPTIYHTFILFYTHRWIFLLIFCYIFTNCFLSNIFVIFTINFFFFTYLYLSLNNSRHFSFLLLSSRIIFLVTLSSRPHYCAPLDSPFFPLFYFLILSLFFYFNYYNYFVLFYFYLFE